MPLEKHENIKVGLETLRPLVSKLFIKYALLSPTNLLAQTKEITMNESKEIRTNNESPASANEIDLILIRLEELKGRCTQLETTLKDTVAFDMLVARLTGKETVQKKNELSINCRVGSSCPRTWCEDNFTWFDAYPA